jgi:four helix bundle protein
MKDFKNLEVWKKSHHLALSTYAITIDFPKHELYGLTSQVRRAAASIPANLAEGCGRSNDGDFHRFVQNAMGSTTEVEYHFLLARDLGLLSPETHRKVDVQIQQLKRMLVGLNRKIEIERYQRK